MMDERNGGFGLALQQAEVAEQCGDLAGRVFVNGMKSHQGIENEKNRTMKHERGFKPLLIGGAVQAQRIRGDHANVQVRQIDCVMVGERFKAQPQGRFGIFSGIEKHSPGLGHGESGQAR